MNMIFPMIQGSTTLLLLICFIYSVNSIPAYSTKGVVDIKLYLIPGFPGEFPTGFEDKVMDRHVKDKKGYGNVIHISQEHPALHEYDADKMIRNQLKDLQHTVEHDEEGLHSFNPKTHLAKTVEKVKLKNEGDAASYLEGKDDQNVISKVQAVHGNADSMAIGHGSGDTISISGTGNPTSAMKEFNDLFKDMGPM